MTLGSFQNLIGANQIALRESQSVAKRESQSETEFEN